MTARKRKPAPAWTLAAMDRRYTEEEAAVKKAKRSAAQVASDKRRNAKGGGIGEAVAERLHAECARQGVARMRKMPTPMKVIGRCVRGLIAVYSARSGVDYHGSLTSNGRAVYVEVKRCTSKKAFAMSEVEPHQRKELDYAWTTGAVAVLLVVFGPLDTPCAAPWRDVREMVTLDWETLRQWEVRAGEAYLQRWAA